MITQEKSSNFMFVLLCALELAGILKFSAPEGGKPEVSPVISVAVKTVRCGKTEMFPLADFL